MCLNSVLCALTPLYRRRKFQFISRLNDTDCRFLRCLTPVYVQIVTPVYIIQRCFVVSGPSLHIFVNIISYKHINLRTNLQFDI